MLALYILIALFIAWIWTDYFRMIDIYQRGKPVYLAFIFLLGALSVSFVFGVQALLLHHLPFEINESFVNDFLYSVFAIGLVEETAKILPFLLALALFRKQFTEPIDYLTFVAVSALGFSAAENVMYFYQHGADIITSRAILASLGHVFDTCLFAYGIIYTRFKTVRFKGLIIAGFMLLAALSHGFYDFWLIYPGSKGWGWIITILYFLITISFFSTILNNCLNQSPHFTYAKAVDSDLINRRMATYYGILFFTEFIIISFQDGFDKALIHTFIALRVTGIIVAVAVTRLSRFKLIRGRWNPVRVEFPFGFRSQGLVANRSYFYLQVKGESYNEAYMSHFFQARFYLSPVNYRNSYIEETRIAYIHDKVFIKDDEGVYVATIFLDNSLTRGEKVLLKAKTEGKTMMGNQKPIVAILRFDGNEDDLTAERSARDFDFLEWAYLEAMESEPGQQPG